MPPHSICESNSPISLAPTSTEPSLPTFGLHRPLLAQDIKKTRNAKRLSLVVPPTLGQEFQQQQQQQQQPALLNQQPPSKADVSSTPSLLLTRPKSSSLSTRRPFTPKPLSSASFPSSSSLGVPPATPCARQFSLDQPPPTPSFALAQPSTQKRSISAYYSNYSLEAGIASPYTWEPVKVLPGLYLGAEHNATDYVTLSRLGITSILNVAVEIKEATAEQRASGRPDASDTIRPDIRLSQLQHKTLPWSHGQRNLLQEFPSAFAFIDEARNAGFNVLVHCQLGVSRSASLVIAYVMRTEKMTLSNAYEFVKGKSGVISPNMSLMYQLVEYEKTLSRPSDDQQQQQQPPKRTQPELRRSDSDSVVLEKDITATVSRRPSIGGRKCSMVIHPAPRSPLRPSTGNALWADLSTAATAASRSTSPYRRIRRSTSSSSLASTNGKKTTSSLGVTDASLTQQQQQQQSHSQRQPDSVTSTLAKYPPMSLAPPSSVHTADPVPSSSDMELTEGEDEDGDLEEDEGRDQFPPKSAKRFHATPFTTDGSSGNSLASLSPPTSRPISTSESMTTSTSLSSRSMAMDCDTIETPQPLVPLPPPSPSFMVISEQQQPSVTPMPSTPTTATNTTTVLTTTQPKVHHHAHQKFSPMRHVDRLMVPFFRHEHKHTHDDDDNAQRKVVVAAPEDDINSTRRLFSPPPTTWSPTPMTAGLLATSAVAVAVAASAAAKQLHHNFTTVMKNSSSSSTPTSALQREGGGGAGSPDCIFSPRPFSPALNESRTFGDFYQALKMEG